MIGSWPQNEYYSLLRHGGMPYAGRLRTQLSCRYCVPEVSPFTNLAHVGVAVGTSICHAGSRSVNCGSRERACGHPARIDRCQGTHCYQFKSGGGRMLIQPDWGPDGERKLIQSGSLVPWPTSNAVITPILCTRSWPVHRFVKRAGRLWR